MKPPLLQARDWPRINADERGLKHRHLTESIIGIFYEVYNELGHGFLESVYECALSVALEQADLRITRQAPMAVWFRSINVGEFRADLIVNDSVIIEIKAARALEPAHEAQL